MIKDLDTVALNRDFPEHNLAHGDLGTVVHVYEGGKAFEVEFVTLAGETVAVLTLDAEHVRPIRAGEIANARQVAA